MKIYVCGALGWLGRVGGQGGVEAIQAKGYLKVGKPGRFKRELQISWEVSGGVVWLPIRAKGGGDWRNGGVSVVASGITKLARGLV